MERRYGGMTDVNGSDGRQRRRMRGESELTEQLINAAGSSPGPLSQEEVDRILGVLPEEDGD
jgi:hypothetical protein